MNKTVLLANYSIELVMRILKDDMDDSLWASLHAEDREKFEAITHPSRKLEWSEGRRALKNLDSQTLKRSLAHTRKDREGIAIAAGTRDPHLRGVGVDVENKSRVISDSAAEWLIHDAEKNLDLDRLVIWMIKEACFKADPEQGTDFTLQAYEVTSVTSGGTEGQARAIGGRDRKFLFRILREEPWLIAVAVALPGE